VDRVGRHVVVVPGEGVGAGVCVARLRRPRGGGTVRGRHQTLDHNATGAARQPQAGNRPGAQGGGRPNHNIVQLKYVFIVHKYIVIKIFQACYTHAHWFTSGQVQNSSGTVLSSLQTSVTVQVYKRTPYLFQKS
jgi:hypothetical protein